jgi:hypothetical protein
MIFRHFFFQLYQLAILEHVDLLYIIIFLSELYCFSLIDCE